TGNVGNLNLLWRHCRSCRRRRRLDRRRSLPFPGREGSTQTAMTSRNIISSRFGLRKADVSRSESDTDRVRKENALLKKSLEELSKGQTWERERNRLLEVGLGPGPRAAPASAPAPRRPRPPAPTPLGTLVPSLPPPVCSGELPTHPVSLFKSLTL
ncbi:hypothetical protein chiPu_0023158, partial [Chiloscyllium punctatum]|nr:hypothetical protein [Chiloscyllium punctatum]